jgi:hypothetical protein
MLFGALMMVIDLVNILTQLSNIANFGRQSEDGELKTVLLF